MAKKTTPEPALTADEKTMLLIRQLKQQKAEIEAAERPQWNTNCSYAYRGASPSNIQVMVDVSLLIRIAADLIRDEAAYIEASAKLGVDAPPYAVSGYPVKEWLADIKTRINKVQLNAKKQKYDILEARLNAIVSPELRAEMELQAIQDELANG